MNKKFKMCAMLSLFAVGLGSGFANAAPDNKTKTLIGNLSQEVKAHQKLAPGTKAFVIKSLLPTTYNPVFLVSVKAQNGKKMSLAQIKKTSGLERGLYLTTLTTPAGTQSLKVIF